MALGQQQFVMREVWLFLSGVNFWHVLDACLMSSVLNLLVFNYYEHATFFTDGHAHGVTLDVKGDIALGGLPLCLRCIFKPKG